MTPHFTTVASSILAALLALSSPALAQAGSSSSTPSGGGAAEASGSEEEGYVPEDQGTVEEEPAVQSAAPSAASLNANRRVEDPFLLLRIPTELLLGYLGTGIGFGGGMLVGLLLAAPFGGLSLFSSSSSVAGIVVMVGGVIGMSAFVPLCVVAAGALWQAKGKLGPAYIGSLIGMAIGLGGMLAAFAVSPMLASGMVTLALVAPVIGAIVGYEVSHSIELQRAVPVAVPFQLEGGGGVALAWAI